MYQKEIKEKLKEWFALMQHKYTWLSIKVEYSDKYCCYLISFTPSSKSIINEEFCRDVLDFEDMINEEYELDAPLFCDGEDLFKLSDNAEILLSQDTISVIKSIANDSLGSSYQKYMESFMSEQKYNKEELTEEYNNKDSKIAA